MSMWRTISAQCARFRVTRCAASPAFFEALLGKMPAFEKIHTGGAPVFPDLLRRLRTALPAADCARGRRCRSLSWVSFPTVGEAPWVR